MTVVLKIIVYFLILSATIVNCDPFYPLILKTMKIKSFLNHRQKRHSPLDTSKLCKAFGCKNGYCKENELRKYRIVCECFTGYRGTLCDKLQCPYSCGKHGTCVKNGQSLRCKCEPGYIGHTCDKKAISKISKPVPHTIKLGTNHGAKPSMFTSLSSMMFPAASVFRTSRPTFKVNQMKGWFGSSISSKLSDIKFSDFHSHAVVDTSVKPDVCAPAFQCYHGNCDRDSLMSLGIYRCICKDNYTGLFCEKKCTLKCKNSGRCIVLDDGHQYCECPYNFIGHYCEKPA